MGSLGKRQREWQPNLNPRPVQQRRLAMAYRRKAAWRYGGFKSQRSRSSGRGWDRSKFARRVRTIARSTLERKHQTYDLVGGAPHEVDWTGRLHHLTNIAAGTGQFQRVGRRITPTALSFRFVFERQTNTDRPLSTTIMVVRDTQQVGDTSPTTTDILSYVGAIGTGLGILNKNNVPRFTVLYRRTFLLADVQSGVNGQLIDEYIKLAPINVGYNGDGTADIERNGLYMLMASDGDPATNDIFVTGNATLHFVDA